jgi:hypothetical protein
MEVHKYADSGQRYQSGETLREIASDLGVAHTTIGDALHSENVELRSCGRRVEPAPEAFPDLYSDYRRSVEDIALVLSVSKRTAYRYRKKSCPDLHRPRFGKKTDEH